MRKVHAQLQRKNIILTGMRGSGKSTLGALLAKTIKRKYIDIDAAIERQRKMSIFDIVQRFGWPYFRSLEHKVVLSLKQKQGYVIATGGGTMMDVKNSALLKSMGKIIYLHATPPQLKRRLKQDYKRPSLGKNNFLNELQAVYEARDTCYRSNADAVYEVGGDTKNRKKDENKKCADLVRMIARWGISSKHETM